MDDAERLAEEFDALFAESLENASKRPWAHPAHLPDNPITCCDRPLNAPDHFELFMQYF